MKADQKQPVSSSSFSSAPLSPSSSPSVTAKIVFLKEFDDTRRPKMAVEDSKRKGSNIVNEHEFNDILNISQEDRTSGCERLLQNVFRCHLIANMLQETSEMVEDQVNEETCGAVKSFAGMTTTGLALDGVEVAHVMVGSEAFKSNKIHAGDVILSVNDQVATTWNVKSVLDARDRAGETVKLRVRSARNSEITEVTIPRQSCADLPQHALLSHYLTLAREDAEQEGSADKHHLITAAMAVWSKIARKAQAKEGKALVRSQEQASRIQQCSASLSPLLEKIHLDIVFLQEELGRAYRYIDELKLSAGKQTLNSSPTRQASDIPLLIPPLPCSNLQPSPHPLPSASTPKLADSSHGEQLACLARSRPFPPVPVETSDQVRECASWSLLSCDAGKTGGRVSKTAPT
eukprot:760709-Hanusia_phi.AAC.4